MSWNLHLHGSQRFGPLPSIWNRCGKSSRAAAVRRMPRIWIEGQNISRKAGEQRPKRTLLQAV